DFYKLDQYYQAVVKIVGSIKKDKILGELFESKFVKEFFEYQVAYNNEFNFNELQKYSNFNDIENSLFKRGVHANIDKIQDKIDYVWTVINSIVVFLKNLIKSDVRTSTKNLDIIGVEFNDRDGYFLTLTKTREGLLKNKLSQFKKEIEIDLPNENNSNLSAATFTMLRDDIVFKSLPKGKTKIFITPLLKYTQNLTNYKKSLTKVIKKEFIDSMTKYYTTHRLLLTAVTRFVSEIDFLVSGARCAAMYYYCKPTIKSTESIPSYIDAVAVRHPISERLCEATEYIPNDVVLGNLPEKLIENKDNSEKAPKALNMNIGKCLDPETQVMTASGRIRPARKIKIGDRLMGDDSTPRTVLGTCQGEGEMYQIVPEKGEPYTVNGPHILSLKSSGYKTVTWSGEKEQRYRATWMQN
ncbi:hypothetical protein EON73_04850, partial [bacterium]